MVVVILGVGGWDLWVRLFFDLVGLRGTSPFLNILVLVVEALTNGCAGGGAIWLCVGVVWGVLN